MKKAHSLLIALAIICAGLGGFAAYLGYFGGRLFVPLEAREGPAPLKRDVAAVVLSGDMGFNIGMSRQIAERLTRDGIPVIGVNSLVYFRHRRSPAEATQLLRMAIGKALRFGHARKVLLIGQSYGADMTHVGLAGMNPAERAHIAMVALIVPTDNVIMRASPAELLELVDADADALTTARKLTWAPTLCFYGREERNSLCPALKAGNVRITALPGGHPLHHDPDALYRHLRRA
ncbi:MAG TPA: AcvB/VirJ family lysyl-phosphatidylglycerol hydrolase, partial [Sphingomonadaceae bacterium]|nr:AcvB/VirJ family lysyl-phosphatidylglycerol hydrolase [Sphingomonadaceae bacterium]